MCGSILDRRRTITADNVVSMPPRQPEQPLTPPASARASEPARPVAREVDPPPLTPEDRPTRVADDYLYAPSQPPQHPAEDDRSFSIFGVDTGEPQRDTTRDVEPLHGPSFLGLGDDSPSGDYLIEDEESHSGRKLFLVAVLVLLGVLAFLQYRANSPARSLWASLTARATGEQAGQQQTKPAAQEPTASGEQPAAPTEGSSATTSPQSNASNQPPTDTTSAKPAAAQNSSDIANSQENATAKNAQQAADQSKAPDQNKANNTVDNAAEAAATPAKKPSAQTRRSQREADMMAKAQRPQSDRESEEQPANDEQPSGSRAKKSAETPTPKSRTDDALVTRAQGFLYGRGGPRSCSTAMSLLKQAAGHGSAKADSQIGAMYATGNCAPYNRAEAYRWFVKAAEADPRNPYLARSRDMMWQQMSPDERRKVLE